MTGKMQFVDFKSVDEFLTSLPDDERVIVDKLRALIYETIPEISEKLSYNVPFFKGRKTICFIWPASVLWGKKQHYQGVRLGFNSGYKLLDDYGILEKGNRKKVYCVDFMKLNDIDEEILKSYFVEAYIIDQR